MQTITQIPTKTYLTVFGPFTMFLEICITFSTLSGFNRVLSPCALATLNSLTLATELTGALRYFQAIVASSGYLWHSTPVMDKRCFYTLAHSSTWPPSLLTNGSSSD